MENIKAFIERWGYVVFLGLVGVALLFDVGCSIYTSVINPSVGIISLVGALCALGVLATAMIKEIKRGDD